MDFTLSDDHLALKDTVRRFAEREIEPHIREADAEQKLIPGLLPKMAEQGLLGICIPQKYGGAGMDYISLGLACEELERADTVVRVVMSVHVGLSGLALLQWGTEAQKQQYLAPQARGERIGGYGLTEPNAGSDVANMQATAVKKGDRYLLNGEKTWISLANTADQFLIFAYTDKSKKHDGISCFIVERKYPGVTARPIKGKLGVRAGDTGSLAFHDVEVPAANLLGREGEGFKIAMSALDNGRFTLASGAVGLIEACLDHCTRYCHDRKTFGEEIGKHQLVQQMLARMVQMRDIGRLLYYHAGWLKNQGVRNTRETSLAKWTNCANCFQAAHDAIQIFGAYGYSNEYPVERYFRNARGLMIYEGTHQIHEIMQAQYQLGYREDKPVRCPLPAWPFEADRELAAA